MIIRSLKLRHGRIALPRSCPPSSLRRSITTTRPRLQHQEARKQNDSGPPSSARSTDLPFEVRDPNHRVAQDYIFKHHQSQHTGHVGTSLEPHYKPHELLSNPPRPEDVTLELLMASQAHIGHATSLWNPANAKYIFGVRGKEDPIHIISLDTTAAYLRRAAKVVRGVASKGGLILFVGTRTGQERTVVRAASLAGGCHLFNKWTPGSITNGQQILGRCRKKVVDENDNEILGFQDQLDLKSTLKPDLVICLNPLENYVLLHECGLHNIPTIGIVDTDVNPTWVTYPIPANDDSLRCVQVICGVLGRAGEEGQKIRLSQARRGIVASSPSHGLEPPTEGQAEKEREAHEREMLALQAQEAYEEAGQIVMQDLKQLPEGTMQIESSQPAAREDEDLYVDGEVSGTSGGGMYGRGTQEQDPELEEDVYETVGMGSLSHGGEGHLEQGNLDISYKRDRPLNDEELAQAPADEASGEEIGRDSGDSKDR